jgi:hypothetical protein
VRWRHFLLAKFRDHTAGTKVQQFKARDRDSQGCALKHHCLKNAATGKGRTVSLFGRALANDNDPSQRMRRVIDSAQGRALYSRRMATAGLCLPTSATISA